MSEAKDEAGIRGRGFRLNFLLIIGASVVVIAGGLLFFVQANSNPGCADKGPCMLYFYADWWVVCQEMEPIVDRLEEKHRPDFTIVRLDVEDSQGKQLAREYGCIGQPAYVFFDKSGEQVRRLMGAQTAETFEQEIERILGE